MTEYARDGVSIVHTFWSYFMDRLIRILTLILLVTTISPVCVLSGETGKIAGKITDKSTGEPLAAANILIIGTAMGAAADANGQYVILRVPPATYSLRISHIGYSTVTVNNVRVYIDQTASVDLALTPQAIEGPEVVITADRPVIKRDVATSVVSVSGNEIATLPIMSVVSAIGLQAGIRGGWGGSLGNSQQPAFLTNYNRGTVSVQQGPSIRGGGGDDMLFMLDGVTLRDPRNNEPMTTIPLSAVQEVSVERGGFNAEYGQVRSGIVNVVTKEGKRKGYTLGFQFRYLPPQPKYWKAPGVPDVTDPYSFALRSFFDPAVCWTGTTNGAWDKYKRAEYPEFMGWNKVAQILNTDNDPSNDVTPLGAQRIFMYEIRKKQINDQPDYDVDASFGGPVPFVSEALGNLRFFASYRATREMLLFPLTRPDYRNYDFNFRINSDITPSMKLQFSGLIGKQFTIRHNWDGTGVYFYPRYPNEIASVISYIGSSSDFLPMFSDFNFALADVGHLSLAAKLTHTFSPKTYYEVLVEHFRRDYYVRPPAQRDTSQKTEVIPGFYEDMNPFGYWPYDVRGVLLPGAGREFVSKARDSSVFNTTTLKADFTSQFDFHNLLKTGIEFAYNDLDFDYGTIGQASQDTTYSTRVQERVFPIRGAMYIQDKLELKEFTVNAGLRLDYSNSNVDWWAIDPFETRFFSSRYSSLTVFPTQESKPQWQLSPRLGVAHPISERAKLFFNYGHYKQVPQYESLFRLQRTSQNAMSSYGNPNLILAKTISYELGFDYLISNNFFLQVAGFYNDISEQQDFTQYFGSVGGFTYTRTTANNYQDTRGIELTLRKTTGTWWSGFANYTYLVTTSGHFGSSRYYDNRGDQAKWDAETSNLYENRPIPQPYARLNLSLFAPDNFGPKLFGHYILSGWRLNTVFDWQNGYWTTWNPNNIPYVAYNVKAVNYYNLYLRLDKLVNVGMFKIQLFLDVNNVLNTLRLWNTTDQAYMKSLHLTKSEAYTNIPGDDKVGNYREPGVDFQPMENGVDFSQNGLAGVIYYQGSSGKYYEYVNSQWSEVEQGRLDRILDDKAYIDMPNASTYWFLDPRRIYFGIKLSFDFD
jgi:outer membrane receptor protein involved in Fe transport